MEQRNLAFNFKTHYFTAGIITPETKHICFALHGYGQLGKYFIRKFNALVSKNIYIIAPEGLSKFYLEDVTSRSLTGNNKVGATWMTRENRLTDIENNINYLNAIYLKEVPDSFMGMITIFGFSQGAATATRWAIEGNLSFQQLILWGGILPPDMDFTKANEKLKGKKVIEVVGKSDPYLTDERLQEMISLNQRLNIQPEVIEFDGGHEIKEEVLVSLF